MLLWWPTERKGGPRGFPSASPAMIFSEKGEGSLGLPFPRSARLPDGHGDDTTARSDGGEAERFRATQRKTATARRLRSSLGPTEEVRWEREPPGFRSRDRKSVV